MKTLNDMGLTSASHVETGFAGWKAEGLPIQTYDEWQAATKTLLQGLTQHERDAILGQNAERIYGIGASTSPANPRTTVSNTRSISRE